MILTWILCAALGLTVLFGVKSDNYDVDCFRIFLGILLTVQSIIFLVLNITNVI